MPPNHRTELLVNGELHSGFTGGHLMRSMNAPASNFELQYSATRTDTGRAWPIYEGDHCELKIDDKTVLVGYVDRSTVGYDPMARTYTVSGRSKTADLIDCSCVHTPREWLNANLARIARDAAQPFGVQVAVFGDSNRNVGRRTRARAAVPANGAQAATAAQRAMTKFKFQAGEPAIEVIRRAAALRGMFLFDGPDGDLVIARVAADDAGVALRRGVNVFKGERTGDWSQRFSEYRFRGQSNARDDLPGSAGRLNGKAEDPTLQARERFRPFVVTKKGAGGREDIGAMAVIERNKRAGQSETYRCTVNDIVDGNDEAWNVGYLADVDDDWCAIRGRMVVVSARIPLVGPWQTDLELSWPEAFDEVDYPTRGRGDVWS